MAELFKYGSVEVEEMVSLFFDDTALREPARQLYRFNKGGYRYYYHFDEEQNPVFYESVTTVIKNALPTSPYLIKWIADMGMKEAERYRDERADFGSFMHSAQAELLISGNYDLDMEATLADYIKHKHLNPVLVKEWLPEMHKAILGFAQFIIDHKVKPLAVEIVLGSDTMGTAGALDLVCDMEIKETGFFGEVYKRDGKTAKKGDPKESKRKRVVRALVDMKSGKNFYEAHELQLEIYKRMWAENFPDEKPIEKVFNWAPKDWRKNPSYQLKDQTESKTAAKVDQILQISHIEDATYDRDLTIMKGVIDLERGLEQNIQTMNFAEIALDIKKKRNERKNKKA